MKPENIYILVGCEESQAVCIAFRELGFSAFSCDLKPCSGGHPEWHLQMDVFEAIRSRKWHAAIFFPDCTYLTCSAEWAYKDQPALKSGKLVGEERRKARGEAYEFFMALWNCGIEHIAMENPVGIMSTYFRQPDQIIQPYQFGDDASKKTCLWLKGFPILLPTAWRKPWFVCKCGARYKDMPDFFCPSCNARTETFKERWSNQTYSGQNKLPPSDKRAELRSKTYPGIAKAMADQWGKHLLTLLTTLSRAGVTQY